MCFAYIILVEAVTDSGNLSDPWQYSDNKNSQLEKANS